MVMESRRQYFGAIAVHVDTSSGRADLDVQPSCQRRLPFAKPPRKYRLIENGGFRLISQRTIQIFRVKGYSNLEAQGGQNAKVNCNERG